MVRWSAALGLACLTWSCGGAASPERFAQKLVILGFDDTDPASTERWLAAGRLPHLAKLAAQGGLHPLETTTSPVPPAAWASFATGVNPGKRNIYDFLVRDPRTYVPDLAMVARDPPQFLFNCVPVAPARIIDIAPTVLKYFGQTIS